MLFANALSNIIGRLTRSAGALSAATLAIAAVPAAAEADGAAEVLGASAGTVQMAAKDDSLTTGDPRFRELFASWTALDDAGPDPFEMPYSSPVIQTPVISVPSRNPLNAGYVSSGYGMRKHPVLGRRARHKGIDLAAPTGTPVYATADGMIERANYSRSYGNVIYIDHGSDLETRYAHLSRLSVSNGERVRKGDLIGYVGSTGRSTGPHLHYEVRVDGLAVNPIPYMKEGAARAAIAANSDIEAEERPGGKGGL